MPSDAVTVFFSYSHADEALRNELAKHLSTMKRRGVIANWHDRKILAGDEWDGTIKDNLNSAQIILLLISADFIASDYCFDVEIQQAMERHEAGEARVVPIILRSCDWSDCPFGKLQALPKNAKAVTSWPNLDEAFTDIAKGLKKVTTEIRQSSGTQKEQSHSTVPKLVVLTQEIETLSGPEVSPQESKAETKSYSVDSAQEKYRKQVREHLARPKLEPLKKILLSQVSQELGISESVAHKIETEELASIQQTRDTYRNILLQLIEAGHYPLDDGIKLDLQQLRQELQLTEMEVEAIEKPILSSAEQAYFLQSDVEIDYRKLKYFLERGKWQLADRETYQLMSEILDGNWSRNRLLDFPYTDLHTIDQLWMTHSGSRFGFSVQNEIYLRCGGITDGHYYQEAFEKFGNAVEWRNEDCWNFSMQWDGSGPIGHLPCLWWGDVMRGILVEWGFSIEMIIIGELDAADRGLGKIFSCLSHVVNDCMR